MCSKRCASLRRRSGFSAASPGSQSRAALRRRLKLVCGDLGGFSVRELYQKEYRPDRVSRSLLHGTRIYRPNTTNFTNLTGTVCKGSFAPYSNRVTPSQLFHE